MKSLPFARYASATVAVMFMLVASAVSAAPQDDEEPEDATVYSAPKAAALSTDPNNGGPQKAGLVRQPGYRCDKLGGEFLGRKMQITVGGNQNGNSYVFWGARVVQLDPDSPLRKLGMVEGDVISRLDGNYLDKGKFMRNGVWHMPELDQHYGLTDIRWIKQGQSRVNVQRVQLDPGGNTTNNGGTQPEAP